MIRDSIKPDITMFVHYETLTVEGKPIIAVTIQKGTDRPYYLGSKGLKPSDVYVRNGTSTDPATDTAIRRTIKETDGDRFETMRSLEQNLTFKAAEEQFKKRKIPFDAAKMQALGMISQDGIYSNIALLLSDQCSHTIKAATFQDRREFISAGGLPIGITLEDIMLGLSVYRNPKLAAIFCRLELIEAYGTGMPKIIKAYAKTGLEPKIEVTNNAFKVILSNRNVSANVNVSISDTSKAEADHILDYIDTNRYITRSDVDKLFAVSQATANCILNVWLQTG